METGIGTKPLPIYEEELKWKIEYSTYEGGNAGMKHWKSAVEMGFKSKIISQSHKMANTNLEG